MIITESRRLIRKFLLLGILLGCLGLVSSGVGTTASSKTSVLPCCSVCEEDPTIPICRHGCSPSCRTNQ
jgi:hypothetical protein